MFIMEKNCFLLQTTALMLSPTRS